MKGNVSLKEGAHEREASHRAERGEELHMLTGREERSEEVKKRQSGREGRKRKQTEIAHFRRQKRGRRRGGKRGRNGKQKERA